MPYTLSPTATLICKSIRPVSGLMVCSTLDYLSGHPIHSLPTISLKSNFAVAEPISPITVAGAVLDLFSVNDPNALTSRLSSARKIMAEAPDAAIQICVIQLMQVKLNSHKLCRDTTRILKSKPTLHFGRNFYIICRSIVPCFRAVL